jgi:hypothetical protein
MKPKIVIEKFQEQLRALMISAFGFVAALAWNDAITSLIQAYIPSQNEWPYMLLKAVILTFTVVIITMFLSKDSKKKNLK